MDDITKVIIGAIVSGIAKEAISPVAQKATQVMKERFDRVVNKAKQLKAEFKIENLHAQTLRTVFENVALEDDLDLESAWAGLMAASYTEEGHDRTNETFMHVLAQMTPLQARIINYVYGNAQYRETLDWDDYTQLLIDTRNNQIPTGVLIKASGEKDIAVLDMALDRLNNLGLLKGGFFRVSRNFVTLAATDFGLTFYVRCQGSGDSIYDYCKKNPGEVWVEDQT